MKNYLTLLFCFIISLQVCIAGNFYDENHYLERAKRKIAKEMYPEAYALLEKARAKEPENAEVFILLGDCNKKMKNFSESIKNYAYARALNNRKDNILVDGALKLSKLF
jgi:tetratricopeptide (TPR) repeat protein